MCSRRHRTPLVHSTLSLGNTYIASLSLFVIDEGVSNRKKLLFLWDCCSFNDSVEISIGVSATEIMRLFDFETFPKGRSCLASEDARSSPGRQAISGI